MTAPSPTGVSPNGAAGMIASPTTRIGRRGARLSGSDAATVIVPPIDTRLSAIEARPSAISCGPDGARPLTITGATGPVSVMTAKTALPATSTFTYPPLLNASTFGSERSADSIALAPPETGCPALVSGGDVNMSQANPDRRGVVTSRSRLDQKISDAMSVAMASVAPRIAERTGTAVRPRPGSSAMRTPTPTVGDATRLDATRT